MAALPPPGAVSTASAGDLYMALRRLSPLTQRPPSAILSAGERTRQPSEDGMISGRSPVPFATRRLLGTKNELRAKSKRAGSSKPLRSRSAHAGAPACPPATGWKHVERLERELAELRVHPPAPRQRDGNIFSILSFSGFLIGAPACPPATGWKLSSIERNLTAGTEVHPPAPRQRDGNLDGVGLIRILQPMVHPPAPRQRDGNV